jgi:hypothetical protein
MHPEGVCAREAECHVSAALDNRAEKSAAEWQRHTLQRHLLCKSKFKFNGSLLILQKRANGRPGSSKAASMPAE